MYVPSFHIQFIITLFNIEKHQKVYDFGACMKDKVYNENKGGMSDG